MSSEALQTEIKDLAKIYIKSPTKDLEALLVTELDKVKPRKGIPVRGNDKEFWLGAIRRLAQKIVDNKIAVSAILGFAVAQVVNWAETLGFSLTAYKIPIAILTAMVVQSVIEQLGEELSKVG
jgi:hypothetical protein